jgi:hypothetical protein
LLGRVEIGRNDKFLLTLTNRKGYLDPLQVAIVLRIKELPKYLYQ